VTSPRGNARHIITADVVVPVIGDPIHDGFVAVEGGRIADIGSRRALRGLPGDTVVALPGAAVFPGLIDTHCHLEWSGASLTSGDGTFADWLRQIMGAGLAMTPDDFLTAAREGARRALLSGTTTVLDAGPTGAGAQALNELGMRGTVHLETFGRHTGEAASDAARELAERIGALPRSARVDVGVSPHAPYTVGAEYWAALADDPVLSALPWMTHLAESAEELPAVCGDAGPMRALFAERGSAPGSWPGTGSVVARLAAAGAFRPGLTAAHCVHISEDDAEVLAASGVGIAHCPVSNRTLGVGTHPLHLTRRGGVRIGLGTDSPASGGRYDLRHDARMCRDVHAEAAPTAAETVAMMTAEAAHVAGRGAQIGALAVGRAADLVAVDLDGREPCEALVTSTRPPRMVMIDGIVRVRDGALVD